MESSRERDNSSAPIDELILNHPPDMAGGGGGGFFGISATSFQYCQEIKPSRDAAIVTPPLPLYRGSSTSSAVVKTNASFSRSKPLVDPPDGKELRRGSNGHHSNRRQSRNRADAKKLLEPLEENSYEDDAQRRRAVDSPGGKADDSSPVRAKQSSTSGNRAQSSAITKKSSPKIKDAVNRNERRQQRKAQSGQELPLPTKKKKSFGGGGPHLAVHSAMNDHDVSELTFRGLDPPERYFGQRRLLKAEPPQDSPIVRNSGGSVKNPSLKNSNRRLSGQKCRSGSVTKGEGQSSSRSASASKTSKPEASTRKSSSSTSRSSTSERRSRTPRKDRADTPDKGKMKKKGDQPPIKSILRKNEEASPPPVAYFGGASTSDSSNPITIDGSDGNTTKSPSTHGSAKSPSYCVVESFSSDSDGEEDDTTVDRKSVKSATSISMRSALRRGTFAASFDCGSISADDDNSSYSISISSNSTFTEVTNEQHSTSYAFDRRRSHFLRTSDLGLTEDTVFPSQFLDDPNERPEPHYHHPSPSPPPGVQYNVDENWICVDDGKGGHSPIAPQAVDALVEMGYRSAADPMLWTPTSKTRKYMNAKRLTFENIPLPGPLREGEGGPADTNCLLWTGRFPHRHYGSDVPVIRAQFLVNKSAEALLDLLMDSNRVYEYNKASVGRVDDVVLSRGDDGPFSAHRKKKVTGVVIEGSKIVDGCAKFLDDEVSDFEEQKTASLTASISTSSTRRKQKLPKFLGCTKLVRSVNRVPLVKKKLEFHTLLHARELLDEQGGNGFIIVSRSVTPAQNDGGGKGVIESECLLNVTIIRRLHKQSEKGLARTVNVGHSGRKATPKDLRNRCLVITMNHVKSPLIPKVIAKRAGLGAATAFMSGIRGA